MEFIRLSSGDTSVTISPEHGGRIAQIDAGGRQLLFDDPSQGPIHWGSYPMVPWAGRIDHGRFTFSGHIHDLAINSDPHALHGVGLMNPWTVDSVDADQMSMSLTLDWPLGGIARQLLSVTNASVTCLLSVTAGAVPMPAVIGWHPWFIKPDSATLRFASMYVRGDDYLPTGQLAPATPPPWDDCFVEPLETIELGYGEMRVQIESSCDHWVVFDQRPHSTCVEPQSGPPNAFNLFNADGQTVAAVLDPGECLSHTMTIRWA